MDNSDLERFIRYLETFKRNDMTIDDAIESLKHARTLSDLAEPIPSAQGVSSEALLHLRGTTSGN